MCPLPSLLSVLPSISYSPAFSRLCSSLPLPPLRIFTLSLSPFLSEAYANYLLSIFNSSTSFRFLPFSLPPSFAYCFLPSLSFLLFPSPMPSPLLFSLSFILLSLPFASPLLPAFAHPSCLRLAHTVTPSPPLSSLAHTLPTLSSPHFP